MRIKIVSDQHRINIPLPNALMFNPVTAMIGTGVANKALSGVQESAARLSSADMRKLFRMIKKCRHLLNGEPLLYLKSSDGTVIEILV